MNTLLSDLKGVLCLMDGVLVYRKDQTEHDKRLEAVLKCIEAASMRLNSDKCEVSKTQLKFLGHIIDKNRVQTDPVKTEAIIQMPTPPDCK